MYERCSAVKCDSAVLLCADSNGTVEDGEAASANVTVTVTMLLSTRLNDQPVQGNGDSIEDEMLSM